MSDKSSFSERMGIKSQKSIQDNDMDEELRTDLWNVFYTYLRLDPRPLLPSTINLSRARFLENLWYYLHKPMQNIPLKVVPVIGYRISDISILQDLFNSSKWYEVYDLIEYSIKNYPFDNKDNFIEKLNSVLESNNSAYRVIDDIISPIHEKHEIEEIEKASDTPYKPVNEHIKTALKLMSDKKRPDYRNSIKESISAVEALVKRVSNEPNDTLAPALDKTFKILGIKNEKLKEAIKNLYGYTNTEDGIRHAMLNEPNVSLEDARFMLTICSAFINYIITKRINLKSFNKDK